MKLRIQYGTAFDLGREIWLANLRIPDRLQGRGIGARTVRRLQRLGKPITLEAMADRGCQTKLYRFYRRLGFRLTNKTNHQMKWTPC